MSLNFLASELMNILYKPILCLLVEFYMLPVHNFTVYCLRTFEKINIQ
jgi:hypothetical protein